MRHVGRSPSILAAGSLAALLLAGCNSVEPTDPKFMLAISGPPDTLVVGSTYKFRYAHENAVGPVTYHISLSDSVLDSFTINAANSHFEFQWSARPKIDTVRLTVVAGNGGDTVVRAFHSVYATGFAPIASNEIRRYRLISSNCCPLEGSSRDSSEITLTPLGAMDGGYRFERKIVGDTTSIDTVHLKLAGNLVLMRTGSTWAPVDRANFPYFVQDTISEALNSDAIRQHAVGYVGSTAYQEGRGSYLVGVGLLEFEYIYLIQRRGTSGFWIKRL